MKARRSPDPVSAVTRQELDRSGSKERAEGGQGRAGQGLGFSFLRLSCVDPEAEGELALRRGSRLKPRRAFERERGCWVARAEKVKYAFLKVILEDGVGGGEHFLAAPREIRWGSQGVFM